LLLVGVEQNVVGISTVSSVVFYRYRYYYTCHVWRAWRPSCIVLPVLCQVTTDSLHR